MTRALLVALLLVPSALVGAWPAAAATEDAEEPPAEGTVLRIGTTSRPDSLNPLVASNANALGLVALLYDPLVFQDRDLKAQPALARSWRSSRDRRTWIYRLRPGQRWSDGKPVTARDAAFSLARARTVRDSPYARAMANVKTIERSGPSRVVVTLKRPSQRPPALAVPVLPQHIWSSVTRAETPSFENLPPVGSGRYLFVEDGDENVIRLIRNEQHWGEADSTDPIDSIELRFFETEAALVAALERGEIDVADDLGRSAIERLAGVENIATHAAETPSFISLGLNTGAPSGNGSPILRDSQVRRAIAHALDRDALRRAALGDYGVSGTTIVPPLSPFHVDPPDEAVLAHDPEQAKRLLDRAGVRDDDGDGKRSLRNGQSATLRLYTRSALPETEVLGDEIAAALAGIGIDVTTETLSDRELDRRINGGRYDLFIWGWASEPDPDFILSVLSCGEIGGRGLSDTYFCDPPYERVYQRQRTTRTASTRKRLVRELQLRAYRESPYVVLYYRPNLQAYRSDRFESTADAGRGVLVLSADPAEPIALEAVPGAPEPEEVAPTGAATEEAAAPAAESDALTDELSEPRAWIVIGVVAIVLVTLIAFLVGRSRRRRAATVEVGSDTGLELFEIQELEDDPDELGRR